jgi:hypothetical protein
MLGLCALLAVGGCAATHIAALGQPRAAISAEQVQIYLRPPASKYQHIADVSASSTGSFKFTSAAKMEVVIDRLKHQAAKLGANGLLLHGVGNQSAGSAAASVNTEPNNLQSSYALGFGASTFFFRKVGDAEAIYVEPQ